MHAKGLECQVQQEIKEIYIRTLDKVRKTGRMKASTTKKGTDMSYDIALTCPVTGEILELDEPHQMKGGTHAVGGTRQAELNVTYNYAEHFYRVFLDVQFSKLGIRSIYGLTGAESIPVLQMAIAKLKDDADQDYWKPTEGNAKKALTQLLALAKMRPDGVWEGD